MRQNKTLRKCIIIMFLLLTLGLLFGNIMFLRSFQKISEDDYVMLSALLGSVKEKYPDTTEEEWVELLNSAGGYEDGKKLLEYYGIFQNDSVMVSQGKVQTRMLFCINMLFMVTGFGMIFVFVCYYKKRSRDMENLAAYIRRVEQGEYSLPILENTEDEMSSLKNELYKVTVMLKEAAILSQNQKKALADSVSDISHQIKTPLTSAMILLDNLSESERMDKATQKRFLDEVIRQLSHVNWLIATLLKLSRLDAGVVEFVSEPFNLDELIEEVSKKLELMAEWKQIEILREGDRNILIMGDFQWMSEAVANIVKNAIEHSPEKAKIILRTRDNTVYTSLCVKDFGEGMDEEEQKHIFERFYRSKNAEENSIGIGLSLAKGIIEQQNGYLTVDSQKGKGTEFLIKFLKK